MSATQPTIRKHHSMRRLLARRPLAIALLLTFVSPFVLPLFAAIADPEASLPACCRRHGKHHCNMTMAMMAMLAASSGPALTTPPCPLYPTAAAPVRITPAYIAARPPLSIATNSNPAPRQTHSRAVALHPRPSDALRLNRRKI
jgi:hypothetical protein